MLIDKFIEKYLDYKFYSNQNQLKDKFDVHYFKLSYIGDFSKSFVKEVLLSGLFLVHSKLKIIFHIKTQFLMI